MSKSWAGSAVVGLIVVGIAAFLWMNLEAPKSPTSQRSSAKPVVTSPNDSLAGSAAPVREFPIGDEVRRNQIRVAAVWLPAVTMDNMPADPSMPMIHLEADVKALENNPNGFAKDESIDYLKVTYKLTAVDSPTVISAGPMLPMRARDGFHYGTSIAMPSPGHYRLTYTIPAPEGLGRHSDPASGVAPWWQPFEVAFDWDIEADPAPAVSLR